MGWPKLTRSRPRHHKKGGSESQSEQSTRASAATSQTPQYQGETAYNSNAACPTPQQSAVIQPSADIMLWTTSSLLSDKLTEQSLRFLHTWVNHSCTDQSTFPGIKRKAYADQLLETASMILGDNIDRILYHKGEARQLLVQRRNTNAVLQEDGRYTTLLAGALADQMTEKLGSTPEVWEGPDGFPHWKQYKELRDLHGLPLDEKYRLQAPTPDMGTFTFGAGEYDEEQVNERLSAEETGSWHIYEVVKSSNAMDRNVEQAQLQDKRYDKYRRVWEEVINQATNGSTPSEREVWRRSLNERGWEDSSYYLHCSVVTEDTSASHI